MFLREGSLTLATFLEHDKRSIVEQEPSGTTRGYRPVEVEATKDAGSAGQALSHGASDARREIAKHISHGRGEVGESLDGRGEDRAVSHNVLGPRESAAAGLA